MYKINAMVSQKLCFSERNIPLLLLKLSPSEVIPGLAELKTCYQLHETTALHEAQIKAQSGNFQIGLVLLNPEISQVEVAKLTDLCCAPGVMQWVALVPANFTHNKTLNEFISGCFFDYHTLPLDIPRLQITLGHALGMAKLARLAEKPPIVEAFLDHLLVGKSPQMYKLHHDIQKIAAVNAPVLIRGESGTGKELIARAIHHYSQRQGPFEAVNCAALPPSLIQSELFGHEKGAFTGAARRKIGRIEAVNGGTIFLDEIGDLLPDIQITLLRFLQEKIIERVGSTRSIQVDVRVLAATHVDLEKAVSAGRFREDLYYRLNVLELIVPPLRNRGEDVELLAQYFLKKYIRELRNYQLRGFSHGARRVMRHYHWPGNVRELMNRIYRAVTMCEKRLIQPSDLSLEQRSSKRICSTLEEARKQAEQQAIWDALWHANCQMTKAAEELQISRATLYRLMEKYQINLEMLRSMDH